MGKIKKEQFRKQGKNIHRTWERAPLARVSELCSCDPDVCFHAYWLGDIQEIIILLITGVFMWELCNLPNVRRHVTALNPPDLPSLV